MKGSQVPSRCFTSESLLLCLFYLEWFFVRACLPAGQHDNGNLSGNDADELIISDPVEMDPQLCGRKMGMRGFAESQQWTAPFPAAPWPQKSEVRPWKPRVGSLQE